MDAEKLLYKISSDKELEPSEIEEMLKVLELGLTQESIREMSIDDVYSYLLVAGKAKLFNQVHLVERYLEYRDPLTAALALEILCLEWGKTGDYLERVFSFALGVSWDEDNDIREMALKILGEYLVQRRKGNGADLKSSFSTGREREVLELLMSIFKDVENDEWTRKSAYVAICRACGKPEEELPNVCAPMDFGEGSADFDQNLVSELEGIISA